MNKFLQNSVAKIREIWQNSSVTQRVIVLGSGLAVLGALILIFRLSGTAIDYPILSISIQDEQQMDSIMLRLDDENISYRQKNNDGKLYVNSRTIQRRARDIILREGLLPPGTSPWELFDNLTSWSVTEFQQNVRLQRALRAELESHIEAIDGIDNASVILVLPEKTILASSQDATTASVIITPRPNSTIATDKKRLQGIEKLITFAVQGLAAENVSILDNTGKILNDFIGLEDFDRLKLGHSVLKERRLLQAELVKVVHNSLAQMVTAERVDIIALNINLDYVDKSYTLEETLPVKKRVDDPATPYDETEIFEAAPLSIMEETTDYEGTNFTPEGPAGVEGQAPTQYKDLQQTPGTYKSSSSINNYVWSKAVTDQIEDPYDINQINVGIAIDGVWTKERDKYGAYILEAGRIKRFYTPVPDEDLVIIRNLIGSALGIDPTRGDQLTVEHFSFDHTAEFEEEDRILARRQRATQISIYAGIIIILIIVLVIIVRAIIRERDRRRRRREEELARKHQAMREASLRDAENESAITPKLSPEDQARLELTEAIMNSTREDPESVAKMIRFWIQED